MRNPVNGLGCGGGFGGGGGGGVGEQEVDVVLGDIPGSQWLTTRVAVNLSVGAGGRAAMSGQLTTTPSPSAHSCQPVTVCVCACVSSFNLSNATKGPEAITGK